MTSQWFVKDIPIGCKDNSRKNHKIKINKYVYIWKRKFSVYQSCNKLCHFGYVATPPPQLHNLQQTGGIAEW
jgi:hypothetical protein